MVQGGKRLTANPQFPTPNSDSHEGTKEIEAHEDEQEEERLFVAFDLIVVFVALVAFALWDLGFGILQSELRDHRPVIACPGLPLDHT